MLGNSSQHIGQPRLRIDIVEATGLDQRITAAELRTKSACHVFGPGGSYIMGLQSIWANLTLPLRDVSLG